MADTSYSWISLLKKFWNFLIDIINFFRGKKQQEANNANIDLNNQYGKIDQDKENGKQNNTEDRLNNLFK